MSKKKEETQVTKAPGTAVANPDSLQDDWGNDVSARDLVIPKILIMQGMTKAVTEGKAVFGEMRDSMELDLLVPKGEALEVIPFDYKKVWHKMVKDGNKFVYDSQFDVTRENERPEVIEWEEGGKEWRLDFCYNFLFVLPRDIEAGCPFPYGVTFKRSSIRTGKTLVSKCWVRNMAAGKTPASTVMSLGIDVESNDQGTYGKFSIATGRASTDEEVAAALSMRKQTKTEGKQLDDSDLKEDVKVPAGEPEAGDY